MGVFPVGLEHERGDSMSKDEHKGAIEVSVVFHEGQRMFAVPKQPAPTVQEPVGEVSGHDWSTGLLYRDLEPGTPLYTTPLAAPEQIPEIPKGWSLVAVKGFDDLMYWLDRCESKGHLENCPDLIEPYHALDYRSVTTPPAAQPAVPITESEIEKMWFQQADFPTAGQRIVGFARAIEAKLKEKNT